MSGIVVFVIFAVLVAAWGFWSTSRWSKRVERARRSLAEPRRRVGL